MKIAIADHFDSFTYNFMALCKRARPDCQVKVFNPRHSYKDFIAYDGDFLFIGPGPGRPSDYKESFKTLDYFWGKVPIFSLCLGMQMVNEYMGGGIKVSQAPYHGKTSKIQHKETGFWEDIPKTYEVMRYHSLYIEPGQSFRLEAKSVEDDLPMAISNREKKFFGVQFHPDSFIDTYGEQLLRNFFHVFS